MCWLVSWLEAMSIWAQWLRSGLGPVVGRQTQTLRDIDGGRQIRIVMLKHHVTLVHVAKHIIGQGRRQRHHQQAQGQHQGKRLPKRRPPGPQHGTAAQVDVAQSRDSVDPCPDPEISQAISELLQTPVTCDRRNQE